MGDHNLFGRLDPNRSADSDVLAQPRHAQVVGSAERERQIGVYGFSQENVGVYGKSDQYIGVYGTGGHLAGYFEGNVEVTGSLTVDGKDFALLLQRLENVEYTLQQMLDIRQSVIDLADQVRALGDSISEIAQIRDKSNDALAQLQQVGIKLGIMEQTLASLSISVSQVAVVAHTHSND